MRAEVEEATERKRNQSVNFCKCHLNGLESFGNYLKHVIIFGCLCEVNPMILKAN